MVPTGQARKKKMLLLHRHLMIINKIVSQTIQSSLNRKPRKTNAHFPTLTAFYFLGLIFSLNISNTQLVSKYLKILLDNLHNECDRCSAIQHLSYTQDSVCIYEVIINSKYRVKSQKTFSSVQMLLKSSVFLRQKNKTVTIKLVKENCLEFTQLFLEKKNV